MLRALISFAFETLEFAAKDRGAADGLGEIVNN